MLRPQPVVTGRAPRARGVCRVAAVRRAIKTVLNRIFTHRRGLVHAGHEHEPSQGRRPGVRRGDRRAAGAAVPCGAGPGGRTGSSDCLRWAGTWGFSIRLFRWKSATRPWTRDPSGSVVQTRLYSIIRMYSRKACEMSSIELYCRRWGKKGPASDPFFCPTICSLVDRFRTSPSSPRLAPCVTSTRHSPSLLRRRVR